MKTIIAEKPSVAREIARIVGATKREEGYFSGNGYAVTWAYGHLVQLTMPEGYGIHGFAREHLPILPDTFTLQPRHTKTEKGYKPEPSVVTQIRIVGRLFSESKQIVVATDAGREGELIFRYLYSYLNCRTPFVRLWISSLTDKAIREGLRHLEEGNCYDRLYHAAKARSEADWLVGINATQAMTIAAGRGTYSLGRVQTPTLAMVCARYWDHKRFTPEAFWQVHLSAEGTGEQTVKFSSLEKWKEKFPAEHIYNKVKAQPSLLVTKVECKEKVEDTPLLYDLTTLQKEANAKHGFTAEKTLEIAQKLYEKKLITYPRTGSRYIPEDVFAEIPKLLSFLGGYPEWIGKVPHRDRLTRRSVDNSKVTDHHALLVTGEKPLFLSKEDNTIYQMIAGRMVEAFSDKCVKELTTVTALSGEAEFAAKGCVIRQVGWRAVLGEENEEQVLPPWKSGDTLAVCGVSLTEGKTKPKPLHTEATLLSAMETAGKDVEDEDVRQAMKECGIGTPATRAAIIETLFARDYVRREKKSLVPTDKGLAVYYIVKDKRIADVEMTGQWETALAKIESGEMNPDSFRKAIEVYAAQITEELLQVQVSVADAEHIPCPKCHFGRILFYPKVAKCSNVDCSLTVFRNKGEKQLTDSQIADLVTKGRTALIKGFRSKEGKTFDAYLTFDKKFRTVYEFPPRTDRRKEKERR